MGKDLSGKELGVGISQRKDGLYMARFTDRTGKRVQRYFPKLQACQSWLAGAQFEDGHEGINAGEDMSVSMWFNYWIENIKGVNARKNTISNYKYRFRCSIEPYIGNMMLTDVRPLHCQNVLNQMVTAGYRNSTIGLVRTAMFMLFADAVENEIISQNPVKRSVKCTQGQESIVKNAVTIEEQKAFLEEAKNSSYYHQYAFVLQTGVRVGELVGLKWPDVDFANKCIHIVRTMNQINGEWVTGTPKSKSGIRDIPLTDDALAILNEMKAGKKRYKDIPQQYHDLVFVSKTGKPVDNSSYNAALKKICRKLGMCDISMHTLRHTFATRCIEAGMKPKTLQTILGHAKIDVTMDIYVHVMEDEKAREMRAIESALKML